MNSEDLKLEGMCWLRYGKRMPVICTEVGRWNADVLGLCDTMSLEIEVKVSKSDLLREFTHKQSKHWYYANAQDQQEHVPNFFYVLVPPALGQEALSILSEKAPKAGLLSHTDTSHLAGTNLQVLRKATRLRNGKPSPQLLRAALARMSSELCGTKQAVKILRNRIADQIDAVTNDIVVVAAGAVGALDCEDAEIDLDQRAAQLAQCVEGKIWEEVQDKDKWRTAAKKWLEVQQYRNKEWAHEALRDRRPSSDGG